MKISGIIVNATIVVLAVSSVQADAAIQPALVNTYGNNVTLAAGNSTVWDRQLTEAQFLATTYAIISQQAGQITWTQNEPNWRPLQLSSYTTTWSPDYAIYHVVAPEGKTFSGGTLQFRGDGVWGGVTFSFRAVDSYTVDDKGKVTLGKVYSEDTHATGSDWTFSNYNIDVPVGQKDFYVIINTTEQWKSYFGNYLAANNIAYTSVPEPKPAMLCVGGAGALLLVSSLRKRIGQ